MTRADRDHEEARRLAADRARIREAHPHYDHLAAMLAVAVPLRIQELRGLPADRLLNMREHVQHADEILYGGPHAAGDTARLITNLAVLALTAEGGVTVAGMHWCAAAHEGCPSRPAWEHLGPYELPEPPSGPPERPIEDVHLPVGDMP
jgi:hypothetical protein